MSDLARIAAEMTAAGASRGDRAYVRLCAAVKTDEAIDLTDHDLVLAITRALWKHELATAQLGLSELEIRTAADAQAMAERRAAA